MYCYPFISCYIFCITAAKIVHFISLHLTSFRFISFQTYYYMYCYPFISFHVTSSALQQPRSFISFRFILLRFISFHFKFKHFDSFKHATGQTLRSLWVFEIFFFLHQPFFLILLHVHVCFFPMYLIGIAAVRS